MTNRLSKVFLLFPSLMRTAVFLILLACTCDAEAQDVFSGAQWVGAITKADAHTPEGRIYTGKAMKESLPLWEAANPLSRQSIYVAKTFSVKKKVKQATMYVCGLGFSEVRIDGDRIDDYEFTPLWSDYDKSVFYNKYDLSDRDFRKKT
ncbi:MAG: alpha-L-rhamnosidase N-terminal domain-containing protein, partial [Prevotella sp.]|nr:alpha-L-rhamnosidase N-terminal domain-containing protein [Prevotella sp.]